MFGLDYYYCIILDRSRFIKNSYKEQHICLEG